MLPAAWARSQPTIAPVARPAAVSRSISSACPVAKFTPDRKTSARSGAFVRDGRLEVLGPDEVVPVTRPDDDEVRRGIQAAPGEVGRQGVTVGREERTVGEDPATATLRPEERGEEEVDVDGQAVEQRDLDRARPDDPRHRLAQRSIEREPGAGRVEPGVDAVARPRVELRRDRRARRSAAGGRATGRRGRSRAIHRVRSGCGTGRASTASAHQPRRASARPASAWAGLRCRWRFRERRVAFADA